MTINLIGIDKSSCTMRVLITLAEKGVTDFKQTNIDFFGGAHKHPDHVTKQPFGSIPVLEDDGFTLFESRAISRYIATKYANQGTKLLPDPTDLKACALFEQWASVEVSNFDPYAPILVAQTYLEPMARGTKPDEKKVAELKSTLSAKLDVIDGILAKQQYMGGTNFSLIDIFYIPLTQRILASRDDHLIKDRSHLKAWWEKMMERESWKELIKRYAF